MLSRQASPVRLRQRAAFTPPAPGALTRQPSLEVTREVRMNALGRAQAVLGNVPRHPLGA